MTDFIIGKACADVTGRLYERVLEGAENGGAIVLIPDQFGFETEKALYRMCAARGKTPLFSAISVKTFSGLSDEIIARYSVGNPPADDIIKTVIMYRAVKDLEKELSAFGRIASRPGFAGKMVKTVAMFKTAGFAHDKLAELLEKSDTLPENSPSLFAKLKDISLLYTEYDGLLKNYTDRLDITSTAAGYAAENGFFKGTRVYVDGFNSFSGSQLIFLRQIIGSADSVTFAFTSDRSDGCRDIFKTLNKDISRLAGFAEDANGFGVTISENDKFSSQSLYELSERVFSPEERFDGAMDGVRIIRADDVYGETDFIAAEIKRLVTEEGMRYNSIAVLCADPAEYRTPIESAFEKYGIPLFCDIPESILHMPLVNLVLSLLRVLCDFSVENVLSYVKTGFLRKTDGSALSLRDIDDLEDYIYKWDLRGSALASDFNTEGIDERDAACAKRANEIRRCVAAPVTELRERIRKADGGCTGALITEQISSFLLDEICIERSIAEKCRGFANETDKELIVTYQALWNTIVQILEAMHSGLSGVRISIKEYYELFRDICAGTTLARPPQVLDSVLVGDIDRTRADGISAVFIAGACSGKFPSEHGSYGIFSEYEAELLGEHSLKIAMSREEIYSYNRYQAYRALTLPTERLYISYPLLDTACAEMKPSETVVQLLGQFDGISEENASQMDDVFYCRSQKALRQRFASAYCEKGARRDTLRLALEKSGDGGFVRKLDSLALGRGSAFRHNIKASTADSLFNSRKISATHVEALNKCKFAYFCTYGLKIRQRRRLNENNTDSGSAIHYVLEKVLGQYCDKMEEFSQLSREELTGLARKYLDEYKNDKLGGDYCKTKSFQYYYSGLTLGAADMLVLLQAEFTGRDYRPMFFEMEIGMGSSTAVSPADGTTLNTPPLKILLADGSEAEIIGKLDRADMFGGNNGKAHIRVVDYKTSGHEFSIPNVLNGINTQMLLYLIAVCDANSNILPGGVSYLPAGTTGSAPSEKALFGLLADSHKQSGMYVSDTETQQEMQKYAESVVAKIKSQNAKSRVSAKSFTPDEENTLLPAQFECLRAACLKQTADILGELYNGNVEAVPVIFHEGGADKKACSYCRYAEICGNRGKEAVRIDREAAYSKLGIQTSGTKDEEGEE